MLNKYGLDTNGLDKYGRRMCPIRLPEDLYINVRMMAASLNLNFQDVVVAFVEDSVSKSPKFSAAKFVDHPNMKQFRDSYLCGDLKQVMARIDDSLWSTFCTKHTNEENLIPFYQQVLLTYFVMWIDYDGLVVEEPTTSYARRQEGVHCRPRRPKLLSRRESDEWKSDATAFIR